MRFLSLLPLLLAPLAESSSPSPRRPAPRTYDTHKYYTLELGSHSSPSLASSVAASLGVELIEQIGELDGHWLVRLPDHPTPLHTQSLSSDPVLDRWHAVRRRTPRHLSQHLRSLTPLSLKQRAKRASHLRRSSHGAFRRDEEELIYAQTDLGIADPMLNQQWHLINTELKDVELNVTHLWSRGITGEGVKVAIIDDGLDLNSDDLHDNFYAEGSYDFNDHTDLPLPRLSDDQHGTRCAGEIAAVKNDVCGVGVAYGSKVAGVRILSAPISDADEAAALNYAYQQNDIYSCSWGPPDDGRSMEAPEGLILKAMVNGVQKGRDGKGSIFVFAAGNGGGMEDQCNFDGYTNSIFSITVGAVDRKGLHPYYSELCAAMMMVAPSSGSGDHIHTTDVGKDKCAHTHGGTSAAAPLAVGVFALALQVRPDLTWRDFQHIAVRNCVFFNPDDPDWETTAAGRKFSYKYGYGKIDAGLFVEAAEKWELVKPQAWFDSPAIHLPDDPDVNRRQDEAPPAEITAAPTDEPNGEEDTPNPPPVVKPSGTTITEDGIQSTYTVTDEMLTESNLERLEHVTVRVWIDHQRRGDVEVEILSPNGITSVLARSRRFDEDSGGFPGWKFMSLKHWDENPVGTWTITVKDKQNPDAIGRFVAWSLQLWGQSIDPSLAKDWAPAEEGQPDEEQTGSTPTTTSQKTKPTEHLPGDHGEASGEAHEPGLGGTPTQSAGGDEDIAEPTETSEHDVDEGFFSGIENLGKNSTWLAGAGGIIVLAGAATGAFFFFRARQKRRNLFGLTNNGEGARGAYEPISEDVPMGLLERGRRKLGGGAAKGGHGSKELYDAFGDGPSDESEDEGETTALRYHDDFLGDGDDEEDVPRPPEYRDEPEHESEGEGGKSTPGEQDQEQGGKSTTTGEGGSSGSGSSWQDAEDELPPRV